MKTLIIRISLAVLVFLITASGIFITEHISGVITIILFTLFISIILTSNIVKQEILYSIMLCSLTLLTVLFPYPFNIISSSLLLIFALMEFYINGRLFYIVLLLAISSSNAVIILIEEFFWVIAVLYAIALISIIMHIITIIRIRKQRDEAQEELTYINARKSIIDVNPHISSQNVMNDKTYSGLRIMEHISKAIETMIDMISTAMEVKSVVYLVHDKKDGFLYPELGVSDEELILHRPIKNQGSILYYLINNKKEINDNLYVGNPSELGFYESDVLVRSIIAVPILFENVVSGIIYIDNSEEDHFTLKDVEILNMYAAQISRLLNFAKYAQKSKSDAAYFSLMNNTVHSLANTLNFAKIMTQLKENVDEIFPVKNIFVLSTDGINGRLLYQFEDIGLQDNFNIQNSFALIVYNQKTTIIKNNIDKRDVKLRMVCENERITNVKTAVAMPIYHHESGEMDIAIIVSDENFDINPTKENFFHFLSDVLQTAVEKARYYENMRDLAIKDGLTGVYNHRYFQEQLDLFIEHSNRTKKKIGLILADIDHFKSFNDTYGHQVGDIVLKSFARTLSENIRKSDFIARYGGEEFIIILNNIEGDIYNTVDKLRETIEAKNILNTQTGDMLSVTASFGISVYPDNGETKDELIGKADKALYTAKENGRNRTELYK